MRKLSIAVDMDQVLGDSIKTVLKQLSYVTGKSTQPDDIGSNPIETFFTPEEIACINNTQNRSDFYDNVPVIDGSQAGLELLNRHNSVLIVSAATEFPDSIPSRARWLQHNFPFIHYSQIVFCCQKGIVQSDIMIDDMAENFKNYKGTPLLFSSYHNQTITGYHRVNSWGEIGDFIK